MPLRATGLSKQHELIIKLENKYPKTVLYASPLMQDRRAFNRAYVNGEVHRKSVFFSPKDIGPLPDSKAHSIAYRDGLPYAWLCSEPKEITATSFEALERQGLSRFRPSRLRTRAVVASTLQ